MTHILFDLDGTLADPKTGFVSCVRFAMSKLNIELAPEIELDTFIGPPLLDTFIELCGSVEIAENAVSLYRQRFSSKGMYENRLYDGMPECLERINDRAQSMYVASSKPAVFCAKIIEHFKLGHVFNFVYGSNLDGTLSDKTDLLNFIIEKEGLPRQDTVMIGDRSFDMIGARNNEVRAIGVSWGYGSEMELKQAGANEICSHPDELYDQIFA